MSGNIRCYEILDLQLGHANFGSSESDLVSDKINEAVVAPRSHGYGDTTATYIRRAIVPSRMYAKHQNNIGIRV